MYLVNEEDFGLSSDTEEITPCSTRSTPLQLTADSYLAILRIVGMRTPQYGQSLPDYITKLTNELAEIAGDQALPFIKLMVAQICEKESIKIRSNELFNCERLDLFLYLVHEHIPAGLQFQLQW